MSKLTTPQPISEVDELIARISLNSARGLTKVGLRKELTALLHKAEVRAVEAFKAKRVHLKRTKGVCFCGMGAERNDVEVTELVEDATCITCIRLASLNKTGDMHGL